MGAPAAAAPGRLPVPAGVPAAAAAAVPDAADAAAVPGRPAALPAAADAALPGEPAAVRTAVRTAAVDARVADDGQPAGVLAEPEADGVEQLPEPPAASLAEEVEEAREGLLQDHDGSLLLHLPDVLLEQQR